MPITQAVNSKANIKKFTNQDVPFLPQFPVVSRTPVNQTTAAQTVYNLGFSVDTSNPNSFLFVIDGKTLSPGVGNDFQFTAINAAGYSSQVTLNAGFPAVPANLNWFALNLGVKKESEFNMDNRFVQLYAAQASGFQAFVDTLTLITPTATTGTPAAGTFYSSITNRASIVDMSQDLKPRHGVEPIPTQAIYQLQNEFGPLGEPVWGVAGDTFGQIRFIGSGWITGDDANGNYIGSATDGDSFEITFYGTGLNLLHATRNLAQTYTTTVDGVAGATITTGTTSLSTVLLGRNYTGNIVYPVVSGLALGIHTVKFTRPGGTTATQYVQGFQVLNVNATPANISVNPGTSYSQAQTLVNSSQQLFAYNTSFTNTYGTPGTRGGRVLIYQKADGTIAKDIRYTNAASANLSSADHTNEEVARKLYFREFAANRTDDFSAAFTTGLSKAFTLEDGTTTLVASNVSFYAPAAINSNVKEMLVCAGTSAYLIFTFVGTGVDLSIVGQTGSMDAHTIAVDGTTVSASFTPTGANSYTAKIISGLPYGTHVLKITRNVNVNFGFGIDGITVYQPKTPVLPSGAVELGAYNILGDFTANATAGLDTIAAGVLRKYANREFLYSGTWTASFDVGDVGGTVPSSSTNASFVQFTFYGTGFDFRFSQNTTTSTWQMSVDGSTALNGFTTSSYGAGITSFTASTGTLVTSTTDTKGNGIRVSGLTLGVHTMKLIMNSGSGNIRCEAMDIITPIHSHKSNTPYDQQNTLPMGSVSLSDGRKFTPIKDAGLQKKNISQAFGVVADPTTTSTTAVPMPDMSVVHTNTTGRIRVSYSVTMTNSAGNNNHTQIFVDGVPFGPSKYHTAGGASYAATNADTVDINVSPGAHKVEIYWFTQASAITAHNIRRNLLVEEI